MKTTLITIGLCLVTSLLVSATPPIPRHPPAPSITATKAIEVAAKFAGPDPNSVRYCNSVTLVEGGMTPAPSGSARHWLVTFQDSGCMRDVLRQVYVNMDGIASDTVPPSTGDDAKPPHATEGQAVPGKQAQAASLLTPLSYRDAESGILFLVESNRHHVVAVDKDGKILWSRHPATDGKLPPYSETYPCPNPAITWIGASTVPRSNSVGISFNSRQAGALDLKTGDFSFLGQD